MANWTPASLTTVGWYDANDTATITTSGGFVTAWADKSGRGKGLTPTALNNLTLGATALSTAKPGITFDGTNGFTNGSFGVGSGSPVSAFAVAQMNFSNMPSYGRLVSVAATGQPDYNGSASGTIPLVREGNSARISTWGTSPTIDQSTNTAFVTSGMYYGGGFTAENRVNGTSQGPTSYLYGSFASDKLGVGWGVDGVGSPWGGVISEVVVITSDPTANVTVVEGTFPLYQVMEGYLAWKWGVQASLPTGHPFKASAPTISSGTTASGVASSAGTSTATGIGRSTVATVASATGAGVATGVGRSTAAAVASSAGTGAATGAGSAIRAAVGSASGAGTASGVGATTSIASAVASSAGVGTASGVGATTSTATAVASSAGAGAATGVGRSSAASVASASGVGAATGIGGSTAAAVAAASGVGTATGVSASTGSVASASGTSTATGVGRSIAAARASSAGAATVTGRAAPTGGGVTSSTTPQLKPYKQAAYPQIEEGTSIYIDNELGKIANSSKNVVETLSALLQSFIVAATSDASAAAAGVPVGGLYNNAGTIKVRLV